jgi:hypothetical protein
MRENVNEGKKRYEKKRERELGARMSSKGNRKRNTTWWIRMGGREGAKGRKYKLKGKNRRQYDAFLVTDKQTRDF